MTARFLILVGVATVVGHLCRILFKFTDQVESPSRRKR